jgi:hypothetical protein
VIGFVVDQKSVIGFVVDQSEVSDGLCGGSE